MSFWWTLLYYAVVFVAMYLLAPKPKTEHAKAAKLGDFRFPKTEEGSPMALFWGRVRLRAPNVMWYGDLEVVVIVEKVKTGLFSSKRVVMGYRYLLGVHLGIGIPAGATSTLLRIWFDEDEAWSGSVSADGSTVTIDAPSLFGGYKKGGGVVGTARYYPGSFTQGINAYLQGVVPDSTLLSAYRGQSHLVLEHVELGESPNIKKMSMEVESIPNDLALGGVGTDGDANPAEVAYDILRSDWAKLGVESSLVDTASFTAAGNTLAAEGHGMSLSVQAPNTGREVLEEVLSQIDGIMFEEPATRLIKLKLIRDDYVIGNLPVFDESNILEVIEWGKSTWDETMNQVRVLFNERTSNYNVKPALAQDMANIVFQNRVRTAVVSYPGISEVVTANKVAARDLNTLSIPLAKMRIAVNRDGYNLRPGDPINVSWPDYGLTQIIMRVQKFDLGSLDNGRIVLDLVQDRFAVVDTIYADTTGSDHVPIVTDATAASVRNLLESPRWINLQGVTADLAVDADSSHLLHLAVKPTSIEVGFDAEVSEDAGATYGLDVDDAEFSESALVDTLYAQDEAPYDTTVGLVIKSVTESAILGSATAGDIRADGKNLVLVGSEIVAYESFTDLGSGRYRLNNVWRGLLDTTEVAHAVDERVWFLAEIGLESYGTGEFLGTEAVKARYLTETGVSVLAAADAAVDDLTLDQRPQRPYCPADIQIGATQYPASLSGQVQTVSWNRREYTSVSVARGDDADETPTGEEYTIDWTGDQTGSKVMGSGTSDSVDFGGLGSITVTIKARFTGPGLESYQSWSWTLTLT